jgi:hypothetical protein
MDWNSAAAVLESAAAATFDRLAVTIQPRKEGVSVNQPRLADPSRAPFDALVTIETNPPSMTSGSRYGADPSLRAMPVTFEAVMTANVALWPYVPGLCDRVREALSGKSWDIANLDRDGTDRAVFYLNRSR